MRPSSSKRFPAAGRFFAANLPVSANLDASLNSSLASRRSLIKASLLAGAGLGASACAKLPTSGPVRVADHDVRQADLVLQYAQGPVKGASPTQIVEGFLLACAAGPRCLLPPPPPRRGGPARQFLAPGCPSVDL